MNRKRLIATILVTGMLVAITSAAQKSPQQRRVRALPPQFDQKDVSRVFFDDLFSRLVGARPQAIAGEPSSKTPIVGRPNAGNTSESGGTADSDVWSRVISATTIEDEIKALKFSVDRTVTTPSSFAGRGHKTARIDFSLLAMLFAIVDQFDGDVRWKASAALARDLFARTAVNLKAGGSIQVFNESKKRKQDLDDLVRGTRLQGAGAEDVEWSKVADRPPLMQLLEMRLESNLKSWTSSSSDFRSRKDKLVREAELTAAIAAVLLREGMDDADDDEYRAFGELLQRSGTELARAVHADDQEAAGRAMTGISRSCVDCHDIYR